MKPRSVAVMLLEKKKADEAGSSDMGDEEPKMPPLEEVGQEALDAMKAGDAKAFAKAILGIVAAGDEDESEPDEDDL